MPESPEIDLKRESRSIIRKTTENQVLIRDSLEPEEVFSFLL